MTRYGTAAEDVRTINIELEEFMTVQYMPILIPESRDYTGLPSSINATPALPAHLEAVRPIVTEALHHARYCGDRFTHVYLTVKHGVATPGSPLNRPGLHTDGFGTCDINYVWVDGIQTDIYVQDFGEISDDDRVSMTQFEDRADPQAIVRAANKTLLRLDPYVVHAAPEITRPQLRSFVKVSFSDDRYNLAGNAHNHEIDYRWDMVPRGIARNLTTSSS